MANEKHKRGITTRQRLFVHAYIANKGNAKLAAIEAGYSARTANRIGYALLHHENVKAELDRLLDELWENKKLTRYRLRDELENMAFSNFAKLAPLLNSGMTVEDFQQLPEDVQRTILSASIEQTKFGANVKIKMHDKKGAIDSLIKLLALDARDEPEEEADTSNIIDAIDNSAEGLWEPDSDNEAEECKDDD